MFITGLIIGAFLGVLVLGFVMGLCKAAGKEKTMDGYNDEQSGC